MRLINLIAIILIMATSIQAQFTPLVGITYEKPIENSFSYHPYIGMNYAFMGDDFKMNFQAKLTTRTEIRGGANMHWRLNDMVSFFGEAEYLNRLTAIYWDGLLNCDHKELERKMDFRYAIGTEIVFDFNGFQVVPQAGIQLYQWSQKTLGGFINLQTRINL